MLYFLFPGVSQEFWAIVKRIYQNILFILKTHLYKAKVWAELIQNFSLFDGEKLLLWKN